jgi:hypothetical protein
MGMFDFPVGHLVSKYVPRNSSKTWFSLQKSSLNQKYSPKFAEIRTARGMGFSFNLIDAEKLLNADEYGVSYFCSQYLFCCLTI